ncbi:MAG: hypothetical protein Kow0092_12780 [Deferrisomatales bacterium]
MEMGTTPDPRGPEGDAEEESPPIAEVSLNRIQVINLVLVAVASAGGLWLSPHFALGVLTGGILMAANFRVIIGVMRAVFLRGSTSIVNVGIYWAKFTGIMLLVGTLILFFRVDAIGFLVGLTTILVAITAEAVLRLAGH